MVSDDFASIPAGTFTMGAEDAPHPEDGEGPQRPVELSAFQIAKEAVTNEAFAAFVAAAGYQTVAERLGGSVVFQGQLVTPEHYPIPNSAAPWWRWVDGAYWRVPDGVNVAAPRLPAVHIALEDALAFCSWSGMRLPTEAEWECAAQPQAGVIPHTWQGRFPNEPTAPPRPKPVDEAEPNAFGLHHACGNVWEWTSDRFTRLHSPRLTRDPQGPLNGELRVVKGGSFLCCPSYCARFHPSSRRGEHPEASTSHLGFRVAKP